MVKFAGDPPIITLMLSGQLAKTPEARTSKNGSSCAVASIRVQAADGDLYTSVTAFGSLAETLLALDKGDPLTVVGSVRLSTYQTGDGETKAGLAVTASRIIALIDQQQKPRERKPKERQPELATEPLDNEIPF